MMFYTNHTFNPSLNDFRIACGIPLTDSEKLIVTGGWIGGGRGSARVQEYTPDGTTRQLANLTQPRYYHACGLYYDGDDHQVWQFGLRCLYMLKYSIISMLSGIFSDRG